MKALKSSIENDIGQKDIEFIQRDTSSDLIHAMEILHSNENLESNTILSNAQVNALSLMNWASQVYGIEFFKHYVNLFPKYRISGDDGRGRKELIQIAEAIQKDKQEKDSRFLELLGKR
jgi:hypothetical protein